MTLEAVLAIALNACPALPPSLAPIMAGVAQHENPHLDPRAVNRNANGTVDVGLAQVNSSNFGWLGLTMETAMDPCQSLAAGAKVLFAKYNGNPPDNIKTLYASGVMARLAKQTAAATSAEEITATAEPCRAPSWDTWGQQECRDGNGLDETGNSDQGKESD